MQGSVQSPWGSVSAVELSGGWVGEERRGAGQVRLQQWMGPVGEKTSGFFSGQRDASEDSTCVSLCGGTVGQQQLQPGGPSSVMWAVGPSEPVGALRFMASSGFLLRVPSWAVGEAPSGARLAV